MHEGINAFLLTEREGQTGKYLAWGLDVQARCSKVHVSWPRAQNFLVRLDLTQSISVVQYLFLFWLAARGSVRLFTAPPSLSFTALIRSLIKCARGRMHHDGESHWCTPNYKNYQHCNLSFRSRRHRPISPCTHKRAIWNRTFRDGHERCQRDYHITRETNTSRPSRTREQSLFEMAVFSSVTRCWRFSWMRCIV